VSILFGKGDGSFQPPTKYNISPNEHPATVNAEDLDPADLDNDGNLDLAIVNGGDSVVILRGNGDARFSRP
jgi:hypothetical protein